MTAGKGTSYSDINSCNDDDNGADTGERGGYNVPDNEVHYHRENNLCHHRLINTFCF